MSSATRWCRLASVMGISMQTEHRVPRRATKSESVPQPSERGYTPIAQNSIGSDVRCRPWLRLSPTRRRAASLAV